MRRAVFAVVAVIQRIVGMQVGKEKEQRAPAVKELLRGQGAECATVESGKVL